ncbi:cupin domain-containing protein [Entomospira culicis]|uniref:Cupin domain-containing protein n=1 Tax=Entomospira culicis TaxID=2719989 RepID=A0A968GHE2_9SPIO|nr:cupin domain-containing protein [Entomospira culicis]NIZ19672.1 cupin domain-containing protein [Entomospira culicis]NIZ69886.1 cupin domain-containing protein [Entomospira culicis]WDI36991.1 cupin domain-containing protein [Entomospira culicis]WDI38620.1 cupin domain-containing protein [Entomospira culicis]
MKKSEITDIQTLPKQTTTRDGSTYHVQATSSEGLLQKCHANIVEVEPGSTAYGYHYHEANEEIFYIIKGEGIIETVDGEISVKAGNIISFPTGAGGAHVIKNPSTDQTLTYLDFSTHSDVEVAHLPKINKIMVISKEVFGVFDKP